MIAKAKGADMDIAKPREGETIGGGFVVFKRDSATKRIIPSHLPFEVSSEDDAMEAAERLAHQFPGFRFEVWKMAGGCEAR